MTGDLDKSKKERQGTLVCWPRGSRARLIRLWRVVAAVLLIPVLVARCGYAASGIHTTPSSVKQTATVPAQATLCTEHYSDDIMGFRLDYPCNSQVSQLAHGPCADAPGQFCDSVLFQAADKYGNLYGLTVFRYFPAPGETITDTVEYHLRDLGASPSGQIETSCCITVGGETAMELVYPQPADGDFRNRQVSVVHDGGEYQLVFWWRVPFQPGGATDLPAGSAAQGTFDTFLRTFAFVPVTETTTPSPAMPTAVPTPTATRVPAPIDSPVPASDEDACVESAYVSATGIMFFGHSSPPKSTCVHTVVA